ncbi:MAG: TIM barrel protein [Nanoarchaeota archaeon]
MVNYTIENIYQGGTDSFKPSYGDVFTGYRVAASELGMTTDPRTANQLQGLSQSLNQGAIPIEVGVLQPETFDTIPKQHFKEMRRMAQLTGAKLSLHAPLIEPSGMGEQGWTLAGQKLAERQLTDAVIKSAELDKDGNVPITIHSAGIPGAEYKITPEGKKVAKLVIVDRESGKPVQVLEEETLYYPHKMMEDPKPEVIELHKEINKKFNQGLITKEEAIRLLPKEPRKVIPLEQGEVKSPERKLEIMNHSQWSNQVSQLIFNKERADEILLKNQAQIIDILPEYMEGKLRKREVFDKLDSIKQQAVRSLENADEYLQDNQLHVEALFQKAYKYGTEEDRKKLKEISLQFQENLEKDVSPFGQSKAVHHLLIDMKNKVQPQMFIPVEKFAIDKSSETFANVAFNAYDKLGDKAPIISIENMFPGMAFALKQEGEGGLPGMNELIMKSKEQFVDLAIKKGISENEAKKQADRMIGMTLDVGHLNIAKKHGLKDEDLRKEVEAIAKHVKHVHITDNFGYSDSHLPPGMGNVPIKDIMQELEKQGFSGRKILETGGWFEHFKTSPYALSLEAMGSPIYAMDMAPYWNQALGLQQGYSGGFGMMLPSTHYQTFGSGFSQLPTELGGQVGGGQGSRMSGQPME